jgi:pyrroline-5-carboxylate reductase
VSEAGIIVLAVKPQNMDDVTAELRDALPAEAVVVSIAAGATLGYLRERLGTSRLIRVMPNVASMVGQGMAVMALCECLDDRAVAAVRDIFMASGRVLTLPEKHLDAVTALSGSGPAFIARFVGLMGEAGVSLGLPEEAARELALQTLTGTAVLMDGGLAPEELVRKVKSPGGTTAEGLRVFEERGLREHVFEALSAAARRARELSQ